LEYTVLLNEFSILKISIFNIEKSWHTEALAAVATVAIAGERRLAVVVHRIRVIPRAVPALIGLAAVALVRPGVIRLAVVVRPVLDLVGNLPHRIPVPVVDHVDNVPNKRRNLPRAVRFTRALCSILGFHLEALTLYLL